MARARAVFRHLRAAVSGVVAVLALHVTKAGAPPPEAGASATAGYAAIAGGPFSSILPGASGGQSSVTVAPFALRRTPVTNAEFLAFVRRHPQWQRGRVAETLADGRYLQHWRGVVELGGDAPPDQPVTHVSWFAARAFCELHQARLPGWYEWEFAAAADAHAPDARHDSAWQQRILAGYAKPADRPLAAVGREQANLYGVYDLHGLVWEWVEDFNALFISVDNRNQGDPDLLKFCGSGALAVEDRENYPVMMRLAMLSALRANSTAGTLGFRCARPALAHYREQIALQTHDGRRIAFPGHSDHPRIVTMFYGGCRAACPLTIDGVRNIEGKITSAERAQLEVLMVTFDPARDTTRELKRIVAERRLDSARWSLARSAPDDVRRIAALLDIPYRALPDGSFNHASVLILLDGNGRELARTGNSGVPDARFIEALRRSLRAARG